jgi:hypothetical protein
MLGTIRFGDPANVADSLRWQLGLLNELQNI